MFRVPTMQGLIRRRMLVNFRVAPDVMQRQLPDRFRPKLQAGYAIAGICLIRLEQVRPKHTPEFVGIASENAAHRVAVTWEENGETREGVFIPRRDTGSLMNHLAGGRVFPGEHHHADFEVDDSPPRIALTMQAKDGGASVRLVAHEADALPAESVFESLAAASMFFEGGAVGFSVTNDGDRLDGLRLMTKSWSVKPLAVESVSSSYFGDEARFPKGSVVFDNALIMRNIEHEWHAEPEIRLS